MAKKKKRNRSKIKGNKFENEVFSLFSLNWSKGEREDIFHRTDNSGGRATMRRKADKETEGQSADMGYNDPIGKPLVDKWSVECKSGYGIKRKTDKGITKTNWCILDNLDSRKQETVFESLWDQCFQEALITKREPVLVFRRNQKYSCIAFFTELFHKLIDFYGIPQCRYVEVCDTCDITILNLDDFFEWIGCLESFILKEN